MSLNIKRFKEQLAALINSPSMSCTSPAHDQSNHGVVLLLANWLSDLDFECDIQAIESYPGKYNLIASKGQGNNGVVFSGHTDTVPCNPELWQQDPFTLEQRDERFYGLGATDMKGFFPVVLAALESIKDKKLNQPIIVLATADEESSMCGARALTAGTFPVARYAIIGEPTGMRPIRMHKGIMMESIRVIGKAGHSSDPRLGRNALEVMNASMTQLLKLRDELQQKHQNPGFEVNVPTLNLGCIHGGDNPNRICSSCEMHFDLRPLPGMPLDDLRQQIQNQLRPIAEKAGCDIIFSSLFPGIEPFEQVSSSNIVKSAESLTGYPSGSVAFATEAPFLQQLGMETIIMGPGSIEQAHQPNEYIELSQLKPSVNIINGIIQKFCIAE